MKKMPIHDMKVWVHVLDMVVFLLEDPQKKQLASLICSINQISDELAPMSVEKGFVVNTMEEKTMLDIACWNEFIELLEIEEDELQKDFQRDFNHTLINFEGFSGPRLMKNKKKEKRKVEKKKKILTKLMIEKEDKGFDVAKCQLVNDKLGNEFMGCFPFGNDPFPSISIDVHCFKRAPPNIVYFSLSDIHKEEIEKMITQYNKFDTEMPIFVIPDLRNANHIIPHKPKKWEDTQDNQFSIVGKQHTTVVAKVYLVQTLILHIYCLMICNEN